MTFRVTQNLLNNVVLQNLNRNAESLMKIQSDLSSGKRLNKPSDDPVGSATAIRLRSRLSETKQLLRNIDQGETQINQADSVFNDMTGILTRAQDLAISQANVTADSRTRDAVAQEVSALINQFVDMLNTRIGNRYIFAGFETLKEPFQQSKNGINYLGDSGEMNIEIESGTTLNVNVSGSTLLPTAVDDLGGHTNLFPYAERTIPLDQRKLIEINQGTGVDSGIILISNRAGQKARIDLSGAQTLGEIVARINNTQDTQGLRMQVKAHLDDNQEAIILDDLTPLRDQIAGNNLKVEDVRNSRVARQLGILGEDKTGNGVIEGRNLGLLDLTTPLENLNNGGGVESGKIKITDRAGNSAVIDISSAQTLTDVRSLINNGGTNIRAEINIGGNGLTIIDSSPPSAPGLISIQEVGTNMHTAQDLGILTPESGAQGRIFVGNSLDPILTIGTPVSLLNRGQGFELQSILVENGPKSGTIDLSKAATVGAIIQTINDSGLDLEASINELGTGISVTSKEGGRTLKITNDERSFTANLIGIAGNRDVLVDPIEPLGASGDLLPALSGKTRLDDLNGGKGISPGLIKITDSLGNSANINLIGVNTIQGMINLINEYGAQGKGLVNVVASISPDQRGIKITDQSIQNTSIKKITSTGSLNSSFSNISVGDSVAINSFNMPNGVSVARSLDLVNKAIGGEQSVLGEIEKVDKDKGELEVRTQDGTLYRVLSQQSLDNFFIGQSVYFNGRPLISGEIEARSLDLVQNPQNGDEQLAGTVESIDTENKTITLTTSDGQHRQLRIITERGLIRVEDIAGGTAASDLGIKRVSVVGSDNITGSPLNPLLSWNTELNLLDGGTFVPGIISISNGDKEAAIDLSNCKTVADMLVQINSSPVGVIAALNGKGTGITLKSRINGTTLMVNKIAEKNPDGSNKIYSDGSTIFDQTADNLGLTGSADVLGNLLFLRDSLLNNNRDDISKTLNKFAEALNRVLTQRTKIGARMNQLTTTQDRGQSSSLRNTETLSSVEDLDVVEAVSNLAARENAFNAALAAASKIIMPTLLDYL